jgi:hypothetical protein
MNINETEISPTAFTAQNVRRDAELLRAEQSAQIFRGFFKSIARGYARLASYGESISTSYQTPRALY